MAKQLHQGVDADLGVGTGERRLCSAVPAPKNASTRSPGAVHSRDRMVPREQWEVLIPDHHPGFITWETYEANTARLRRQLAPTPRTGRRSGA